MLAESSSTGFCLVFSSLGGRRTGSEGKGWHLKSASTMCWFTANLSEETDKEKERSSPEQANKTKTTATALSRKNL